MTKNEAKEAIAKGLKVRHKNFEPYEYVQLATIGRGLYETEDGFSINPAIFWLDRRNPTFDNDWEIYEPPITK